MFIPEGFAQIDYHFLRTGDTEEMIVSFGAAVAGTLSATHAGELKTAGADSQMQDITTNKTALARVVTKTGTEDPSEPITAESLSSPTLGAASEQPCPQNVALLIRKLTARGGRKGRGRMYYPDVQRVAVNEAGLIDTTSLANYRVFAEDWLADTEGLSAIVDLVLLHAEPGFGEPDPITQFIV